ncbi:hypothetical protein CRD60_08280, partial [Bifidobacterium aemilianum]
MSSLWLGFQSQGVSGVSQDDTTSNSADHAWAGHLRDFVTKLVAEPAFAGLVASSTYTATGSGTSAAFSGLAQGIYVVVDTTAAGGPGGYSNSIPMLVGTAVGVTSTFPGYTRFKNETSPTAPILGRVEIKNDRPTITKQAVHDGSRGSSASIGGYVKYRISG